MAATKASLLLCTTPCLALHMRIIDQAPIESHSVHSMDALIRDGDKMVVKRERYSGDCLSISTHNRCSKSTYVSEYTPRVRIHSSIEEIYALLHCITRQLGDHSLQGRTYS